MPLSPGTQLGSYRIDELLGAGGMGEVYRARDTKLQREVALKVLPESFAGDRDRLARFRREAQVLAALNHPNIAQIHGLEDNAGATTLVMELVQGDTLAARIAQGALPVDEALAIARQIADALEAAHGQHIIHRDLKPANIALRADGVVKVLDFGLAKAMESSGKTSGSGPGPSLVSDSPTLTNPTTMAGMILGTAAYMAPEQARGKPVDHRADIWAFGCVLFEMLAGRRAFDAEDVSLTLARVLERDPDYSRLPAPVPLHVSQTLHLCLQKDARQRLADIRDVRLALDGAFVADFPGEALPRASRRLAWQRPLPLAIAAGLLLAAGVTTGRLWPSPQITSSAVPVQLSVLLPADHQFTNGNSPSHGLAISPDGMRIVMRAQRGGDQWALYLRSLTETTFDLIPGTEAGSQPAFSPDGKAIVFVAGTSLKTVRLDGGLSTTLAEGVPEASVPVWRGSEVLYVAGERREISRIPASGGSPQRVAVVESSIDNLAAAHDNEVILVERSVTGRHRIEALTAATGNVTLLLDNAQLVAQPVSTNLLFVRDGALMAAPFDVAARQVGAATPVLRGFARDSGGVLPQIAVSGSDTVVYAVDEASPQPPTLMWVDAFGNTTPAGALPANASAVDLSARSALAAVAVTSAPFRAVLWDMQRQVPTGMEIMQAQTPRWHPDGRRLAVSRQRQLLLFDAEDGSESVLATLQDRNLRSPSFSADGLMVAFVAQAGSIADIYGLTPEATSPQPVFASDAPEHSPALSPDGRWIAYVEARNEPQVYIARFPSGTGRRRITVRAGNEPLWRRDGGALFYREYRDASGTRGGITESDLYMATVDAGDALTVGAPRALFPLVSPDMPLWSSTFANNGASYYVTPDGSRFLLVFRPRPVPITEIAVVQNWRTELERTAPRQ